MRFAVNIVVLIIAVVLISIVSWFLYFSGYRFSPIEAAMAHLDVEQPATEFGEVNLQWGKVYLLNTSRGIRTVLATKDGLLWQAPAAVRFPKNSDKIKTVGWMSYSGKQGQVMVFAVETSDPTVSYIEVGPTTERIRKEITDKGPVVFSWNKVVDFNNFNPVAFSKDDQVLYEYRFPKDTTTISSDDLKWYPASGAK